MASDGDLEEAKMQRRDEETSALSRSSAPPHTAAEDGEADKTMIRGRLNAGEVELREFPDEEGAQPDGEQDAPNGPEQQILSMFGQGGGGQGANSPSGGIVSNVVRAVLSAPFHPIKLVNVLIQLGYEPSPPEQRYSFIFRQYLWYYPGIFGYARSIVRQDGWRALYRGVGGSMFAEVVHLSAIGVIRPTVNHLISRIPLRTVPADADGNVPDTEPEPENVETIRAVLVSAMRTFLTNSITSVAVELVVHPFHVISIRMIAQQVGKEHLYDSVWSSIKAIYREEGLSGFYSGIVPALLAHLTRCVIYSSMWILFELMAIHTPYNWAKMLIRVPLRVPLLNYLPRSYSYPFMLMSNVMAANTPQLRVSQPPYSPIFNSWTESYKHLKSIGALYRGSVVLFPRFVSRERPLSVVSGSRM